MQFQRTLVIGLNMVPVGHLDAWASEGSRRNANGSASAANLTLRQLLEARTYMLLIAVIALYVEWMYVARRTLGRE